MFEIPLDIGEFRCCLVVVWELRRAGCGVVLSRSRGACGGDGWWKSGWEVAVEVLAQSKARIGRSACVRNEGAKSG